MKPSTSIDTLDGAIVPTDLVQGLGRLSPHGDASALHP
jgi:hypothetical protein